jgi:hypothetical protein
MNLLTERTTRSVGDLLLASKPGCLGVATFSARGSLLRTYDTLL